MKLTVDRTILTSALQTVTRVASTTSHIQAAHGVRFRVTADKVTVQATDLDTSLSLTLEHQGIEKSGDVVIPGKLLLDVVKSCSGATVTIAETGDGDVSIVAGNAEFELRTYPLKDFPNLPEPAAEASTLPFAPFINTIEWVLASASKDATRPVLCGAQIRIADGALRATATDSYRLSVAKTTLTTEAPVTLDAVAPATALQELARLAKATGAETVSLSEVNNSLVFDLGTVVLSTRLVAGSYPEPDSLIPEQSDHVIPVDAHDFSDVIHRMGLLCKANQPVVITFNPGAGTDVRAAAPDVGTSSETVPEVVLDGAEPLEIGFNPEFLKQALQSFGEATVDLRLQGPLRPLLISDQDGARRHLIMPIRVNV